MSYIFGGNTGQTYESIKRQRAIADKLRAANSGQAKTAIQGVNFAARDIVAALKDRKANKDYAAGRAAFGDAARGVFGNNYGMGEPTAPEAPNDPYATPSMPSEPSIPKAGAGDATVAAAQAMAGAQTGTNIGNTPPGEPIAPPPAPPPAPAQAKQVAANYNPQELFSLMTNDFATPEEKRFIAGLLEQSMAPPDRLEELEIAQAELDLAQDRAGGGGGPEYGLNPQYGVNDDGEPVLIQIGKDGTSIETPLPPGVSLSKDFVKVDAGTQWILLDPITRQPVGQVPKNNFEAASETAQGRIAGETEGEARASLGQTVADAQQSLDLIEDIITDPALKGITGMVQGRSPPLTQAGTDLNEKIGQLQGQAFARAFETLKGGGAISEKEGEAATRAIARLERVQGDKAYLEALKELQGILIAGIGRAQAKAGKPVDLPAVGDKKDIGSLPYSEIKALTDEQLDALSPADFDIWEKRMRAEQ